MEQNRKPRTNGCTYGHLIFDKEAKIYYGEMSVQFFGLFLIFPAPLVKDIVFSPLYIFASFAIDKVSIDAGIYLWAFYFVPLIYISVFVPVPYYLDHCSSVVENNIHFYLVVL